jgi:hypothetical protein
MSDQDIPDWLRRELDGLDREVAPQRDLWPGIRARLRTAPRTRPWLLAVAAGLAIASASALITWHAARTGNDTIDATQLLLAEWLEPYEQARALHQTRWNDVRDDLDPETAEVVERNLAIIRAATVQLAEALAQSPHDTPMRALLDRTLTHELALYQQASQLALYSWVRDDAHPREHAL